MSDDTVAAFGWLLAAVGMIVHLAGALLGFWTPDYTVTWAIPLGGFFLMVLGSASA